LYVASVEHWFGAAVRLLRQAGNMGGGREARDMSSSSLTGNARNVDNNVANATEMDNGEDISRSELGNGIYLDDDDDDDGDDDDDDEHDEEEREFEKEHRRQSSQLHLQQSQQLLEDELSFDLYSNPSLSTAPSPSPGPAPVPPALSSSSSSSPTKSTTLMPPPPRRAPKPARFIHPQVFTDSTHILLFLQ